MIISRLRTFSCNKLLTLEVMLVLYESAMNHLTLSVWVGTFRLILVRTLRIASITENLLFLSEHHFLFNIACMYRAYRKTPEVNILVNMMKIFNIPREL